MKKNFDQTQFNNEDLNFDQFEPKKNRYLEEIINNDMIPESSKVYFSRSKVNQKENNQDNTILFSNDEENFGFENFGSETETILFNSENNENFIEHKFENQYYEKEKYQHHNFAEEKENKYSKEIKDFVDIKNNDKHFFDETSYNYFDDDSYLQLMDHKPVTEIPESLDSQSIVYNEKYEEKSYDAREDISFKELDEIYKLCLNKIYDLILSFDTDPQIKYFNHTSYELRNVNETRIIQIRSEFTNKINKIELFTEEVLDEMMRNFKADLIEELEKIILIEDEYKKFIEDVTNGKFFNNNTNIKEKKSKKSFFWWTILILIILISSGAAIWFLVLKDMPIFKLF